MCDFRIDTAEILRDFDISRARLMQMFADAAKQFEDMVTITDDGLSVPEKGRPLTRMIARAFDAYDLSKTGHSSAI